MRRDVGREIEVPRLPCDVSVSGVEITPVDAFDDSAMAEWHAAFDAGARAGRDDPPVWKLPELIESYRDPDSAWAREAYVAREDGAAVGAGQLEYPLRDNLNLAEVGVFVPPDHRRRGVGAALYDRLVDRVGELGRTTVGAAVEQPVGAPETPGVAFAKARGFTLRNVEHRRVLRLPVPTDRLDRMEAEAAPRATGYRVRTWRGHCPNEYAEQYARLRSLLSVEAPLGEVAYEREKWDVARLRAEEALLDRQDRVMLTAVAVGPDDAIAGHTQLVVPMGDKKNVYQWDTLVLAEHRGHRLGTLLKVTNLRVLASEFPERGRIETWNARQNDHMNVVNDALGFETVEEYQEWQRD